MIVLSVTSTSLNQNFVDVFHKNNFREFQDTLLYARRNPLAVLCYGARRPSVRSLTLNVFHLGKPFLVSWITMTHR